MSHKPKLPAGATSPYPLNASQAADRSEARHDLAEAAVAAAPKPEDSGRGLRFAAGAAIGSAAVAAALIFYNRSRSN
jgi:hypothetical protein